MTLKQRLASQSTVIFAARLFGAGLIFLAQAAIARLWGSVLLGEYLLIVAVVNLVAVVMPLGFHTIGTYFAADYRARGERGMLWKFMLRAYGHIVGLTALMGLLALPLAGVLGAGSDVYMAVWAPSLIMALATAVIFVNGALLVGLKRPMAGFFADSLFRPLLVVAAFAIAVTTIGDGQAALTAMLWLMAAGYIVVAAVHFLLTLGAVRTVPETAAARAAEPRRWWRFATPWVLISLATDFFFDIDLILLAGQMDRDMLAVFGVCTRIFALVSFGVAAIYAVTLPDMFEDEANADRAGFLRKIGDANLVAAGLSMLFFVGMSITGPLVLLLFGTGFLVGSGPLAVLCLGLVVRSVFGPASLVLSIHDRPYASLPAVGCGLVTLVVGNLLLVPPLGLMGAALAALIAISLWSAALWYTAFRLAGVDVSIFPRLREMRSARAASAKF